MSLIKDEAIVLRRLDYSETSQVLAIFTRDHGQKRTIARGIKRSTKQKASVGIDLLERGSVVIFQREGHEEQLGTITEWQQRDTFGHIRRDLLRWYAGQYAAEAVSHLTEVNDPHPALFDGTIAFFERLGAEPALAALDLFLWLLLKEIGLRPELGRCMACGNAWEGSGGTAKGSSEPVLYFSSREGGAICRDCEAHQIEKLRISPGAARALIREGPVSQHDAKYAFALIDYHLTQTLGRPLRLSAPLKAMLRAPAAGAQGTSRST